VPLLGPEAQAARAHARYHDASALFRSKPILSQSHSTLELHMALLQATRSPEAEEGR
jgi:hypothetical protein